MDGGKAVAAHFGEVVPLWLAVLALEVSELAGEDAGAALERTYEAAFCAFCEEAASSGRADPAAALRAAVSKRQEGSGNDRRSH